MPEITVSQLLTKTQADGAQTISLSYFDSAKLHQIQVNVSASPAAGTLTIAIKTPGAEDFAGDFPNTTIDLTAASIAPYQFYGFASQIKITPASFDADKTYTVTVCSGGVK